MMLIELQSDGIISQILATAQFSMIKLTKHM